MLSDEEIALRANYHANVTLQEMSDEAIADYNPNASTSALGKSARDLMRKELARAYVIGFAAGAEAQAGVIRRRPISSPPGGGRRGRRNAKK